MMRVLLAIVVLAVMLALVPLASIFAVNGLIASTGSMIAIPYTWTTWCSAAILVVIFGGLRQ